MHRLGSIAPVPSRCNTQLSGVTPLRNKPKRGHEEGYRSTSCIAPCVRPSRARPHARRNPLRAPQRLDCANAPPHREHSTPSGTFHPIGNIPPDQNGLNLPDQVESSSTQAQMRGLPSRRGTSAAENCACATAHARHASGTQEVGVRATNRAQKPTRHAPATHRPAAPSQGQRASSARDTRVTPQRAHTAPRRTTTVHASH